MASRRVRRDSETSTDSWSLVEEDHLEDDISIHSTDVDEENEHSEPIVEEPPTSDEEGEEEGEEDEDTASEKSLNSDSESCDSDSDCSSDSDSDSESDSDMEKADSEELTASENEEEGENSDLEIQIQKEMEEEGDDSEEEEEEEEEEMSEEEKEAVRQCKEEDWYNEEEEQEEQEDELTRFRPIQFFITLGFIFGFFVAADRYTSYLIKQQLEGPLGNDNHYSYSPQCYNSKRVGRFGVEEKKEVKYDYRGRPLQPLQNKLNEFYKFQIFESASFLPKKSESSGFKSYNLSSTTPRIFENYRFSYKNGSTKVTPRMARKIQKLFAEIPKTSPSSSSSSSLAPIPPAPFTPRKQQKLVIPRHQPCLVHVNESKWTCKKQLPEVYKSHSYRPLVGVSKRKNGAGYGKEKKNEVVMQKKEKKAICGKKASESMRTISKQPTDQCDTRHFTKYTPRRRLIAAKTPLPCKAPNYKPSHPKPTKKPSQSSDDWYSKRTAVRAQLRSRA